MQFVIMLVLLWLMMHLAESWCPPAGKATRALGQFLRRLLWSNPVRRFGFAATLMAWLGAVIGVFVLTAIAGGAGGNACVGFLLLAGGAYLWWRFLSWRAHRRFTPRPMPTRRGRGEG